MTDEQEPAVDRTKPPENATGRQMAKYLLRGIQVRQKNAAAERAAAEAKKLELAKMMAEKAEADRKAARVASLRAEASVTAPKTPKQMAGQLASILWMPQLNLSFQGFGFAIVLLVQTFAQVLMAVGLLPPDHPARTAAGAKGFGLFRLLEEARLNLLPLNAVTSRQTAPEFAGIRALAVRQYTIFSAVMGVMITGGLSIFFGLARVIFGTAHAYAQSLETSGIGIGGCTLAVGSSSSSTALPDLASNCLDGIFGTGTSGGASIIGSGLGTMFSLYSTLVLVFAGIIVLWIIVSAVADTARTGVPFGKNFNPVWAPIRLIVALGLLVPLSSGLNSGQYIIINMAKWGSQQATTIWSNYAQKMIAPTATANGGTTTSGLASVPYDTAGSRLFAYQMFQIALCEAVQNQTCTNTGATTDANGNTTGGANCNISPKTVSNIQIPSSVQSVSATGGTSSASTANQPSVNGIRWIVPDAQGNAAAGYPDCGGITLKLPPTVSTGTAGSQSATNNASQTAVNSLLTQQNNVASTLESSLQSVANEVESDAQTLLANGDDASSLNSSKIQSDYNNAVNSFLTSQQNNLKSIVSTYNGQLLNNASTAATQNGWISAPVWIMNIVNSNATVADAANALPTVTVPAADAFGVQPPANAVKNPDSAIDQWGMVHSIFGSSISPSKPLLASTQNIYSSKILNALQNLTQSASNNPLAAAGTYGRDLMVTGFTLVEPADSLKCLSDPAYAAANPGTGPGQCDPSEVATLKTISASGQSIIPSQLPAFGTQLTQMNSGNVHGMLFPIGMIMISMGLLLVMLTFLLLMRFISGVLQWLIMVFEAILAMPLTALSLLKADGDGFMPQQFSSNLFMILGVVMRPALMTIGVVLSLVAFNTIMQITNLLFAPSLQTMDLTSDNSYLSLGIYVVIYATLAYTLANSSFKLVDLMPNWVMGWIGARIESRVDDVSSVQQQVGQYTSTLAYSSGRGGGGKEDALKVSTNSQTGVTGQPQSPPSSPPGNNIPKTQQAQPTRREK